jgi:hypothetical protein
VETLAQYPFWEGQGTRPISLTGGPRSQNQQSEQKARQTKSGGKNEKKGMNIKKEGKEKPTLTVINCKLAVAA